MAAREQQEDLAHAYAQLGRFDTAGIGGAMGCAIRFSIVRDWVRTYLREHGRLPTGVHEVRGRGWQGRMTQFETRFPSPGIAALMCAGHRFSWEEVWGTPDYMLENIFRDARRQYRSSPDRRTLRAWLRQQIKEATEGSAGKDQKTG